MKPIPMTLCLSALLVLGGCDPEPGPGPGPGPTPEKAKLETVTVTCENTALVAGEGTQCTASAKDTQGEPFEVSSYEWTSSNEALGKVASGKVTTQAFGSLTVTATASVEGITRQGSATLSISERTTLHTTPITSDETWSRANSPHVVRGQLEVGGDKAPTLTLEAGAEVRFEPDAELRVARGALKAPGTAEAPIRLVASQATATKGAWRGVVLAAAGSGSQLSHVTLSHCGAEAGEDACLVVKGGATPVVGDVTVQNSGSAGVDVADDGSGFGADSARLTVTGSQGLAVRVGANQADTLPTGVSLSGNGSDTVTLLGQVVRTQRWPRLPFAIHHMLEVRATSTSAPTPTLTLSAGTPLRFGRDGTLSVGRLGKAELVAEGTEAAPILFTADSTSPQPGSWKGLIIGENTTRSTRLSYVTVEYAGIPYFSRLVPASLYMEGTSTLLRAALVVDHVVLRKGSGYGVYASSAGVFDATSKSLSVLDHGGYAIGMRSANTLGSIPTGGSFTGNSPNAVEAYLCDVRTTQTWPNLGIPYVLQNFGNIGTSVEGETATLTLLPGTELRFGRNAGWSVGAREGGILSSGSLKAEAPELEPIRFVADSPTPTKGFWRGLHTWNVVEFYLDNTVISGAGAAGDGVLGKTSIGTGNLNVYRQNNVILANSTVRDSSGCGITTNDGRLEDSTPVNIDYTFTNTVIDNDGGKHCKN